jgi:hypothetical protein
MNTGCRENTSEGEKLNETWLDRLNSCAKLVFAEPRSLKCHFGSRYLEETQGYVLESYLWRGNICNWGFLNLHSTTTHTRMLTVVHFHLKIKTEFDNRLSFFILFFKHKYVYLTMH